MHKLTIILLLVLVASSCALAQTAEASPYSPLIPYAKGQLYGFADTTGRVVIEPIYTSVKKFRGELSWVTRDGKTGVIRRDGTSLFEAKYDKIDPFGEAAFRLIGNGKAGLADLTGSYILKPQYEAINFLGKKYLQVTKNGKKGIIKRGEGYKQLVPPKYDKIEIQDWRNAILLTRGNTLEKRDLDLKLLETVDLTTEAVTGEEMVMEDSFEIPPPPPPGSAAYRNRLPRYDTIHKNGKTGMVIYTNSHPHTTFGTAVPNEIPAIYDHIDHRKHFSNFIVVVKDGKWGAVTLDHKPYLPIVYDSINTEELSFQNFHFKPYKQHFMVKKEGKWGIVGSTAKFREVPPNHEVLVPFLYDGFKRNGNNSGIYPILNGKYGLIRGSAFRMEVKPEYDSPVSGPYKIDGFKVYNTHPNYKVHRYVGHNGVRFFED